MAEQQWPTWLVIYNYDGAQWSAQIVARDYDDAKRRLAAMGTWGTVDGELVASIPANRGGFAIPAVVWFRNFFKRT